MATVTLVELSAENWEAVANLKVRPEQDDFIAPNLRTIAETQFHPWTLRRVALAEDEIVGFAVYGTAPGDSVLWLHRFMIDGSHQGLGYGREVLRLLMNEWRSDPATTVIQTSYEPDNAVAEHLYVSAGFVPGEIAHWGERIATFHLKRGSSESG
jgi:diamine N-acetyltransferase